MNRLIFALALGAAALAAPLSAQGPGGGGNSGGRDQTRDEAKQRADMIFQMIDVKHTGIITRDQAQQAVARFQAMRRGNQGGQGGRAVGMLQRLIDEAFGGASSLTLQKFEAEALARFDAMDLNHDGVVTAQERQQYRQMHSEGLAPVTPVPRAGLQSPANLQ